MSKKEQLSQFVAWKIDDLTKRLDSSSGRAALANLRRGVGKVPGELPELWGIFLEDLDEGFLGKNGKPSKEEWAIYISLTLFALHQQGKSEPMHKINQSLGNAAAMLMTEQTDDERSRVMRRFGPVVTASDMNELSHHLRGLVQLFKANERAIPLDYVKLAGDIYDFQFDDSRKRVQLRWGQDFYYNNK